MDIRKEAREILPQVIAWRRQLHQIPEVGFDLPRTAELVKNVLNELNIPYSEQQGCECGLVAHITGDRPGRTVALRADMDALPVAEETGLSFASCNGNMHACGHDAHMAILLGAAKLLMSHRDKLTGEVRLIFQPAEELGTGSQKLIDAGALDGVDEILGLHVGDLAPEPSHGQLLFKPGSIMASMDRFIIDVKGKGSHGSTPERSVDPVIVGAHIVCALQEIVSREISPQEPAVVSVCEFQAGSAFNIIPDSAHMEGTVRAFSSEMREFLRDRIGKIAENIAASMRASIEYEFMMQPPPLVNDREVTEKLFRIAGGLYPDSVGIMDKGVMGGEDFARYAEIVPGSFFFLQNAMPIDGISYSNHNPKFAIDESVLDRGVAVLTAYAMEKP